MLISKRLIMKNKEIFKIIIPILVICLWGGLIFSLSAMKSDSSNGTSTGIIGAFIEDTLDLTNNAGITRSYPSKDKLYNAALLINAPLRKVMHASVYFVLAILLIIFINKNYKYKKYLLSLLITMLICFAFACLDEYHQTFVDGRTGRFSDVIIDSTGALVGTIIYGTYYLTYNKGYNAGMININKEMENNHGKRKKKTKN